MDRSRKSYHESSRRGHESCEKEEKRRKSGEEKGEEFSFEKYKSDLNLILKKHDVVDYGDFWLFLKKFEKMKKTQTVDCRDLIPFDLVCNEKEIMKTVTTRSLTPERIRNFLDIVAAFLNFRQIENFNRLKKIRKNQKELPVAAFEDRIVELFKESNVLIIAGDTGCGKSTQVPQFLFKNGIENIACTQPRRLACISLCNRLKYETLSQHKNEIGYQIRFERHKNKDTKIVFLTEGLLLRQMISDPSLSGYDVIILDEVHERHIQSDFLLGLLKFVLLKRTDLRVVLMSATINIHLFSEYFGGQARILQVPGRLFPVQVIYKPNSMVDVEKSKGKLDPTPYLQIIQMIDEKYRTEKGDLLIFLSGMNEIMRLADAINEYNKKSKVWIILPLHSSLSLTEQDKVFDYAPDGYRKCIISTNIAETSVTIDGIRFVIDSGKVKEMCYDSICKIQRLKEFWISRSSAEQRKGRAGRTGPGICYRIYSEEDYASFEEYATPEIKRVPLDTVLLQLISMGLPDVRKFPFLEEPAKEDVENCIVSLKQQNALREDEKLTEIGKMLTNLPVELSIGKMLIIGSVLRQSGSAIALASALSVQSPYTNQAFRDVECENARKEFESDHGDPITLINLYRKWLSVKKDRENSKRWCRKRGLEEQRFYEMTKLWDQFKDILIENNLMETNDSNETTRDERMIRQGEIKLLKRLKADRMKESPRKKLKIESFEIDNDNEGIDVKDIDFRLKNDSNKVRELLDSISVLSHKNLILLKIVYCSGLYPQFAVADEFNSCKTDQVFHTKKKGYVFLHPYSYFGLHSNVLKLEDQDVVVPNTKIKYSSKTFSSRHQILCYLNLLETNKIYLTNMIRMPAIQSFLFFSKNIDASFSFSKIVCDNWILFEVLNPRQSEILIGKLIKLRQIWNSWIDSNLTRTSDEKTTALADPINELLEFFNTDVVYGFKRLLPADLKYVYVGKNDFAIRDNPFDPDYKPEVNETKGGVRVTEYLTYNCLLPNEHEDFYESDKFECSNCNFTFDFNCLERIEHRSKCKSEVKDEIKEIVQRKANAIEFNCTVCKNKYFLTSIEILKHKKQCK